MTPSVEGPFFCEAIITPKGGGAFEFYDFSHIFFAAGAIHKAFASPMGDGAVSSSKDFVMES